MKYKPFLIASMKVGLELDIEPWLAPKDAFSELNGCFLRRGVLEKSPGYIEKFDTEDGHPIVGIFNYITSTGSRTLLIADTKRLFKYSSGTVTDLDAVGGDYWTGDTSNFISSTNFGGICYMANNKDQCRQYNGTTVSTYKIDISGDTNNDVAYCRFIVAHKNRIIIFSTSESGTLYPRRARWCSTTDVTDWTGDEYIDCPTDGWLYSIEFLGDDIIGMFNDGSSWKFKYTGNPTLPFIWVLISNEGGSIAPHGSTIVKDKCFMLDYRGIKYGDTYNIKEADLKIPDFVYNVDTQYAKVVYAERIEELRHVWILYPELGQTVSNKLLALNYDEGNYSTHDISMSCLGFYWQEDALEWDDLDFDWDGWTGSWVEPAAHIGYPLLLAGSNTDGKVYQMLYGGDYAGSAYEMTAISSRWNPYKELGNKARLGYIDFLVENNLAGDVSVDFFLDFSENHYLRTTLSFDGSGEKAWIRVFSGATGSSHRIKIYQNDSGQLPKIHAFMPYFRPVGEIS
jgi:hypothetical protein